MITITLTDNTTTLNLPVLNVPLEESIIENATDVVTLDNNVYTDFISQKREWSHTWAYLSKDEYEALRGFYDRQFTLFKYPLFTIDYYSITEVPVRMTINTKNTIDQCGTIKDVTVIFRETSQLEESIS